MTLGYKAALMANQIQTFRGNLVSSSWRFDSSRMLGHSCQTEDSLQIKSEIQLTSWAETYDVALPCPSEFVNCFIIKSRQDAK